MEEGKEISEENERLVEKEQGSSESTAVTDAEKGKRADSGIDEILKKALSEKAESRKVRGKVKFINPEQLQEIISERVTAIEQECTEKIERMKMLHKSVMFENEEFRSKMIDYGSLVEENGRLNEKLEESKDLFVIKEKYDRMLELVEGCESPEDIRKRIDELSNENTSLRERISVLEEGLAFIDAVNPAPRGKGELLIKEIEGKLDKIREMVPEDSFSEIKEDFEINKSEFDRAVALEKELLENMNNKKGTIKCAADLIKVSEKSRGLYEKFKLLGKITG